jgi:hypothetical protein
MTLLNAADALFLGDAAVDRVYLGATQVWPADAPPSAFATWGDTEGATLTDSGRTLTWGGGAFANGYGVSDAVLAGKQRWQVKIRHDYAASPPPDDYYTAAGVWSRLPENYWGGNGIFHSAFTDPLQPAAGVSPNEGYTPCVTNGVWGAALDPALRMDDEPLFWFECCTDAYMVGADYIVELWIRQAWDGGTSTWMGGGDPATGADPTTVLSSANPHRIGASVFTSPGSQVSLLHPDDFIPTPPVTGFATGVPA